MANHTAVLQMHLSAETGSARAKRLNADTPEWSKMCAGGQHYDCMVPSMVQARHDGKRIARMYNDTEGDPDNIGPDRILELRTAILRRLVGSMPDAVDGQVSTSGVAIPSCYIEPPIRVDYGCNIHLGSHTYANHGLMVLDCGDVFIGDRTVIGPNVEIYCAGHPIEVERRRKFEEHGGRVVIGEDCWIGGRAVIVPGVTIGNGVTVAAGAVVTKDVPGNCVVAGTPARIIKRLEGFENPLDINDRAQEVTKEDLKER
ncbi:hypothetical protein PYCC9005_000546 [Savitreella phatthalungensis]